jgi:hypothetical protein
MPNWVSNTVSIEGEKEIISEIKEKLARPTKVSAEGNTEAQVISFLNIVGPPDDKWDEYHGMHGYSEGEKKGDTEFNWYNFNQSNWGVKWDACDPSIVDEGTTKVVYEFQSPWSPPIRAFIALSEQYPTITITDEWIEEQGFGSTVILKNGEDEEVDSFDWMCGDCDYKHAGETDSFYNEETYEHTCPNCGVSR